MSLPSKRELFLLLIIFSFVFSGSLSAQDSWWKEKKYKSEAKRTKFANCRKVFVNIANGINYSNVFDVISYFGSEVYLNTLDEEKGYYSPEQARLILENFFGNSPVSSFKWRLSSRSENYAFASGHYKYQKNGFINTYDLSVSLKYSNELWLIDQIIIN
jgi:hypothetical protein